MNDHVSAERYARAEIEQGVLALKASLQGLEPPATDQEIAEIVDARVRALTDDYIHKYNGGLGGSDTMLVSGGYFRNPKSLLQFKRAFQSAGQKA